MQLRCVLRGLRSLAVGCWAVAFVGLAVASTTVALVAHGDESPNPDLNYNCPTALAKEEGAPAQMDGVLLQELGRSSNLTEQELAQLSEQTTKMDAAINSRTDSLKNEFYGRNPEIDFLSAEQLESRWHKWQRRANWVLVPTVLGGLAILVSGFVGLDDDIVHVVADLTDSETLQRMAHRFGYRFGQFQALNWVSYVGGVATLVGGAIAAGMLESTGDTYRRGLVHLQDFEKRLESWEREQRSMYTADSVAGVLQARARGASAAAAAPSTAPAAPAAAAPAAAAAEVDRPPVAHVQGVTADLLQASD